MAVERDTKSREICFVCDACGSLHDTNTDNWNEALAEIKEEGWKIRKIGEDWVHCCSRECLREI